MQNQFVHLHVHTEYSLLDGACRIDSLAKRVAELGQPAVAITDHGVMFGCVDFYLAAKKAGVKPIIGCEVYVAPKSRFDKVRSYGGDYHHLVLLCKNDTGYRNLIKLVSKGFTEGFYNKPRIDHELLEQYHEGLVCLSACLAGEIPQLLLRDKYEEAKKTALWYKSLFGEDYYLEIQQHGIDEQHRTNPLIIKIADETGIPLVATNDAHYISKEDSRMQHVLLCIQTNHTVNEDIGMEFPTDEFYIKSHDQMASLFPDRYDAIENTLKIAEKCSFDFEFGVTKLPYYQAPDGKDNFDYFRESCYEGLHRHYGENPEKEIVERLEYELGVIKKMGYVDYFLIVNDFIQAAKRMGIPVGPGRGSGAGSICAYCIGITGIDPIRYNLLFERFLNPERISMPDFDVDFCYERRQEVIDYVIEKYGADHVAQITTFGTMAARGSIRDVGRALGISYNAVDTVAKLVPMELNITLDKALEVSAELRSTYENDAQIKELIDMAKKIEGMPRHASTHAAGVVITHQPVSHYVPLQKNDEAIVTQYPMNILESLGLLKMDFLGLRTLTVIHDCEMMVRRQHPDFDIEGISDTDIDTFKMLSSGQTDGVFQLESAGMRQVLQRLNPRAIEDIIAIISLYRPGPMDFIPTYIENSRHPEKVSYHTPLLEPILGVTKGCMVYQEQVMQIFRSLAGYSLGRADLVRRAMSKKKKDVMEKEREIFINGLVNEKGEIEVEGCVRRGVSEKTAVTIFDEMASFASYAFNKSHAAAYAMVAYRTAYLKCHYPCEFLAALLTSVLDNTDKVAYYISECQRLGIKVLPPNVNESRLTFTVVNGNIRYGLLAVKNLGKGTIQALVAEREKNGKYKSFYDFCYRLHGQDFNRRMLEALIKCGALDNLGANRRQMLLSGDDIINRIDTEKRGRMSGQMSLFDMDDSKEPDEPQLEYFEEFSEKELLQMEKEASGIYLTGHPLARYEKSAKALGCVTIASIKQDCKNGGANGDGANVLLLAAVDSVKRKATKNNSTMAFVTAEDTTGSMEMLVFPKILDEFANRLVQGTVLLFGGRVSGREDEAAKLIPDFVEEAPANERDAAAVRQRLQSRNGGGRDYQIGRQYTPRLNVGYGGNNQQQAYPSSGQPDRLPQQNYMPHQSVPPAKAPSKNAGLYIRVPSLDSEQFRRCMEIVSIFEGTTDLFVYFCDVKQLTKSHAGRTMLNEPMLSELKRVLGDNNVAIKD